MKSFDKFQYGRTDLHELKIGERMSSVGSGIQRTMAKTRLKARARLAKRGLSSDKGRFAGRAAAGAGQEVLGYKPDTERTDTQQGGMGTALRASGGFGRSIVKGAINAPSERIDPNKRKTAGGRLLARTKEKLQKKFGIQRTPRTKRGRQVTDNFDRKSDRPEAVFGKSGEREKSGITKLGKPANTPVGKTTERPGVVVKGKDKIERLKQFRRDQLEKRRQGVPGQRSPAGIDTDRSSKTPEQSILSAKRRNTNRQIKNISRDPQQKIVDRQMKQAENEIKTNPKTGRQMIKTGNRKSPEDRLMQGVNTQANKDTIDQLGGNQTPKRKRGRPKGSTGRRATRSTPEEQAKNQRIANEIKNRPATTPRKATETTVNRNETSSKPKQLSIDGLNIGGTKASGRPKTSRKPVKPVMQQSGQLNLDGSTDKPKLVNKNTGRELNKNTEDNTLKQNDPKNKKNKETKVNESTNRIAAQRQMKKELPNQGKMRTVDQMDDDKAKQAALQKNRQKGLMYRSSDTLNDSVQYSDWREEFIWETDKKYPEKVKEIKPMSGKNTITINPEDETSKYKRGY